MKYVNIYLRGFIHAMRMSLILQIAEEGDERVCPCQASFILKYHPEKTIIKRNICNLETADRFGGEDGDRSQS